MQTFNLINQPWISVQMTDRSIKLMSLQDCFKQANEIKDLAGDSKAQDLSILRLLLAILTRSYNNTTNPQKTWQKLYQTKHFAGALDYLNLQHDNFDFFGEKPFGQVTKEVFIKYASKGPKKLDFSSSKPVGVVPIKQINRSINESGNSLSTTSFISTVDKNKIDLSHLIRWLITYQQFTGVSDKVKLTKESNDAGELLSIKPIYLKGKTLAETLVLNLILSQPQSMPAWEYSMDEYADHRLQNLQPESIPELYTMQSRMIWLEWVDKQPIIHAATYPKVDRSNLFIEPMTTWHWNKKAFVPDNLNLNSNYLKSMWRNFGEYINDNNEKLKMPGIIKHIHHLEEADILPLDFELPLETAYCVKDKNASSQTPVLEISDELVLPIKLAFENRLQIQDLIDKLQQIASKGIYYFGSQLNNLYDVDLRTDILRDYYYQLDQQFKTWLKNADQAKLTDEIDKEKQFALKTAICCMNNAIKNLQFKVATDGKTVFDYKNIALSKIRKELDLC